jgi:hypothetical protein
MGLLKRMQVIDKIYRRYQIFFFSWTRINLFDIYSHESIFNNSVLAYGRAELRSSTEGSPLLLHSKINCIFR